MTEQPWGRELPLDVKASIDDLFPGSKERRKIAYTLMFYNHRPSVDEQNAIADAAGRSKRTVSDVLRILSENDLFADTLGSVPLYRNIQKMGAAKLLEGLGDRKGGEITGTPFLASPEKAITPIEAMAEANPQDGEPPQEDGETGSGAPMRKALPSSVEVEQLRGEFGKVIQRMDRVEASVDKSLKEILNMLSAKAEAVPLPGVVPVVQANPLSVDPDDAPDEVEQEPVEVDEGPFAGMSKQQVIDMAINSPEMVYALRNQGVLPTSDTIQAVAHTTRWLALELTTYTQAAYERSVEDGYEGSLSDFINNAVYKYFADRGKVLQWVDTVPRQPPYYPQPPAYPRRLGD